MVISTTNNWGVELVSNFRRKLSPLKYIQISRTDLFKVSKLLPTLENKQNKGAGMTKYNKKTAIRLKYEKVLNRILRTYIFKLNSSNARMQGGSIQDWGNF